MARWMTLPCVCGSWFSHDPCGDKGGSEAVVMAPARIDPDVPGSAKAVEESINERRVQKQADDGQCLLDQAGLGGGFEGLLKVWLHRKGCTGVTGSQR